MELSPGQHYYILVSNFFNRKVGQAKPMIIAYIATPPQVKQAIHFRVPSMGTPKVDINSSDSWTPSTTTNETNLEKVSAVNYKPAVDREMQMSRSTLVKIDEAKS